MFWYSVIIVILTGFASGQILGYRPSLNFVQPDYPNTCRRIDSGWVCGAVRDAEDDVQYLSFRGIPYAKQPVGELRFKELLPPEPWGEYVNATEEGPNCPQYDELYGRLADPQKPMNEACIYANVHVPIMAQSYVQQLLPIFVFIHGGGFQSGSGDTDLHGPEYLVKKGMIVITFNYRINVFGFFSMNNRQFPGNNGLRDMRTLLLWVRRNAVAFGGNPNDVTLAGQSAGAACAHLLSLSKATRGLFRRVMIMSGTALEAFYSSAPSYAKFVATKFLKALGINSTDPDYIHSQLVNMPLDKILMANRIIQTQSGLVSFVPVVEGSYPGVTRILDDNPTVLVEKGRGKEFPLIIGYTSKECEFFKRKISYLVERVKKNPFFILAPVLRQVSAVEGRQLTELVAARYCKETPILDAILPLCTDFFFIYPAFKLAQIRAAMEGAPVYLYQFSFDSNYNVVKDALVLEYNGGSAHVEDLTFIFRTTSMLGDHKSFPPQNRDNLMKHDMTAFVANFIRCDKPICTEPRSWPPVNAKLLNYQSLDDPVLIDTNTPASDQLRDMISFFDGIQLAACGNMTGSEEQGE